jgi:very-short-patch-repair endonuclease
MTPPDLVVARLGLRQLGLTTRPQLLSGGLTRRQIDRRVGCGRLIVVHENVYRLPAVKATYEQAVLAACLATGGVASHRAAARLFRLRGFEKDRHVEICVDGPRAPVLDGVVAHRSKGVERTTIGVVPVAMPAEVLLQLAAVAPGRAEGAVNDVLCRSLATLPGLVRFLQRRGARGRDGTELLRELVVEQVRAGAPTESWLEDRLVEFLRARGYPEPVRQRWLRLPGRRVRLDLAWPDRRVDLEADGRLFHTSPAQRRRDAARDAAVMADGWVVERVTWLELVESPHLVDARLGRWFREPAGEGGPVADRRAA